MLHYFDTLQTNGIRKLLLKHLIKLKNTHAKDEKPPRQGMKKPAAINYRGKPRQFTTDAFLLQIWQKLSHPLLLSFYQNFSNLSQNLSKKPNQILPNLFNKITSK